MNPQTIQGSATVAPVEGSITLPEPPGTRVVLLTLEPS
jgi:hypothetical protein